MKTPHAMLLVACFALPLSAACGHQRSDESELVLAKTEGAAPAEKTYAPVDLHLNASARSGDVDVVLKVTPHNDLPNAHARIVLPEGATLLRGATEAELGALTKGEKATLSLRVRIPDQGEFAVAGGVEVQLAPGRKVARSVVMTLGTPGTKDTPRIITLPEGGSVHVPN